jgi:TM2 domain-containing membrane protein YozV
MSKTAKAILLVLILSLSSSSLFADSQPAPKASWPAYALSVLLGFGTGQFYLGENGIGFLIGDASGVVLMGAGYFYMVSSLLSSAYSYSTSTTTTYSTIMIGYGIIAIGALTYLVSRIWEIVDTFVVADKLGKEGRFALLPIIEIDSNQASVQLSFRY